MYDIAKWRKEIRLIKRVIFKKYYIFGNVSNFFFHSKETLKISALSDILTFESSYKRRKFFMLHLYPIAIIFGLYGFDLIKQRILSAGKHSVTLNYRMKQLLFYIISTTTVRII